MSNLLVQQYGKCKREWLKTSPFECLLNTDIDINPHQVDAFCCAVNALKTGGIILADEVGLGKTIEAGLVIKYVIKTGAKKILLALPASLRKQWEIELEEKFNLDEDAVKIIDRGTINFDPVGLLDHWLLDSHKLSIAITSYDFSSKLMKKYPSVKWDFIVIDEAHNLRNVFHGTKRAKRLYDCSHNIPKILLTATPLQNSLTDLHGLVSFIDDKIFGSEKAFNKQYTEDGDYTSLKRNLSPVLYRTLRRDVSKYMHFANRESRTFDFELTLDERELYMQVNNFLKRDNLYCLPNSNRRLLILVVRKLLASSSFALIETFEVMRERLEKLKQGTKSAKANDGFELFWQYLDDEIDEDSFDNEDADIIFQRQQIQEEIEEIDEIIETAKRIKTNAKIKSLKTAVEVAFNMQRERGINEKVVIFTESKRTQKYIAEELISAGYDDDDIVLFNGENSDEKTRKIYKAYQVKNFGKTNYGPSVERKHAIVDYFANNAKILILTDAGSEGLNLQFCNTVINYDLPWNPMKIEQRIGRCHRYGQQNDVVAINLLNTSNAADKRVYDILAHKFELFDGVFGASNIALGILESGINFENEILEIYQRCSTSSEFKREFDKLDRHLDARRNTKARQLRDILLSKSSDEKIGDLDQVRRDIDRYLYQVEFWENIEDEDFDLPPVNYWRVKGWGEEKLGSHGYIFVGAMYNNAQPIFPVLLLTTEEGEYVEFDEDDLLPELVKVEDEAIVNFKPTPEEVAIINKTYNRLIQEMVEKYNKQVGPIKAYNRQKMENWERIQQEQYLIDIGEVCAEVEELTEQAKNCTNFLEKVDIRKKADEKLKKAQDMQAKFHQHEAEIHAEAEKSIAEFDKQFDINPILLIKVVVKY